MRTAINVDKSSLAENECIRNLIYAVLLSKQKLSGLFMNRFKFVWYFPFLFSLTSLVFVSPSLQSGSGMSLK